MQKQLIREILEVGKPYKIKRSPRNVGIYKRTDDLFWAADILLDLDAQALGQIIYTVRVKIKPMEFDDIDAWITHPDTDVKRSDGYRANPGYHFYTINQEMYRYAVPNDSLSDTADQDNALHEMAQIILADVLRTVEEFVQTITKDYGDIYSFFIARKNEKPIYAGLSYIHFREYQKALECFELADAKKQFPHIAIRNWNRFFHQVCMDYCKVLQSGGVWKDEYVVNGLSDQ